MFGSTDLYAALNVSAITDLLATYASSPALFSDSLLPQDLGANDSSINFYMSTPFSSTDYQEYTYSINCRASSYNSSRTIASIVHDNIHRTSYGDYYIYLSVLSTISPADDTDNYNTPIEAIIKTR